MPDKANRSGFDKCNSCVGTSDSPDLGPLSTVSHPQVCCLFKVSRQVQSALSLNKRHDGLCENCPSRRSSIQFYAGSVRLPPPSSSNASQQGIVALATGCKAEVTATSSRSRKKLKPRKRVGFEKFTLELRPSRFKSKIWLGTYSEGEIERAMDAVKYYLELNEPYALADSPRIFAQRPLMGIKLTDLLPSCDQVVDERLVVRNLMGITVADFLPPCHQVAGVLAAHVVYGRQVKKVIHSVLGKQKKSAPRKNKKPQLGEAPQKPDATVPTPWSTEDDEELTALLRSTTQPHPHELLCNPWGDEPLPLDEMFSCPTFSNSTSGEGESSTTEERDYSILWDQSFSYE